MAQKRGTTCKNKRQHARLRDGMMGAKGDEKCARIYFYFKTEDVFGINVYARRTIRYVI